MTELEDLQARYDKLLGRYHSLNADISLLQPKIMVMLEFITKVSKQTFVPHEHFSPEPQLTELAKEAREVLIRVGGKL